MKDFLHFLVTALVDNPNDIRIQETKEGDRILFTLEVNPSDMGKIIGKSGRIIRAIRDLMKVIATKHNQYIDVVLKEEVK